MNKQIERIIILGGTGQLGNTLTRYLVKQNNHVICSTYKNKIKIKSKILNQFKDFYIYQNVYNQKRFIKLIEEFKPNIVINCIGLVKQKININNIKEAIYLNSYFPHFLSELSSNYKFRLIHISSDCVFSGNKGNYSEKDIPDPTDIYGKTKYLGEISDNKFVTTLRTSYVGREIFESYGLLEWLLKQKKVYGFKKAFFSGIPTIELSEIISNIVIPKKNYYGLFNISSRKISKFDFLKIIIKIYNLNIRLNVNNKFKIDRSLNSKKFRDTFGYRPSSWLELAKKMRQFN